MEKIQKHILLPMLVTLSIIGAISIHQGDDPDPEDLIIGEWFGLKPEGIHWKFTDNKLIKNNDLEFTYTLTKGATTSQCRGSGYDAVYKSEQLVLVLDYEEVKQCYIVDGLTEGRLVLFSEHNGQYLSFKKQE